MLSGSVYMKNSMEISQGNKNRAFLGLSNSTSSHLPLKHKGINLKTPMFIVAFSIIARIWKHLFNKNGWRSCGIDTWNKKRWSLAVCNKLNGTRDYHVKVNESEEGQKPGDFTYLWWNKIRG